MRNIGARCEQYNTNLHATRAFVRVALFRPDTNAHSMLIYSGNHLHNPSQKQWLGEQEPPRRPDPVLRRAPMNP